MVCFSTEANPSVSREALLSALLLSSSLYIFAALVSFFDCCLDEYVKGYYSVLLPVRAGVLCNNLKFESKVRLLWQVNCLCRNEMLV